MRKHPRAHHYVPQCWLAGFTESGVNSGRLWVTDFKRKKQWQTTPANAGHCRDFYRASALDPGAYEHLFSRIESWIAPLLNHLCAPNKFPDHAELKDLLYFVAVQWIRVPAFRPTLRKISKFVHKKILAKALSDPESWRKALLEAGMEPDGPGTGYEQMRKFVMEERYEISAENDWYVFRGLLAIESIYPALLTRHWSVVRSERHDYIGSDNPVVLDGPPGKLIGFKNAEVIGFPVNRQLFLLGTKRRQKLPRPAATPAFLNTLTMINANEQIYSSAEAFQWLDENRQLRTDWKSFDRGSFLQVNAGRKIPNAPPYT